MRSDSIAPSGSWQGHLHLEFDHQTTGTRLTSAQVQAPLKVQRPFYPEGEQVCHTVMLHTAGGVVGGDRLHTQVTLHPQAQALLTTAAAAKIYRSNGAVAQQTTHLVLADHACLEWLPQETILFNGALYQQNVRVDLAEGAVWLGWEITRLGRSARGEQFQSGRWRSHTEVWQQNRPLWIDRQWIEGGSTMLTSPHGLANGSVVGSFALLGQSIAPELVEQARAVWQSDRSMAGAETVMANVGVTRLPYGLLCRYRGQSTTEARRWFTRVWDLLRPAILQRRMCKPRVWQQ